MARKSCRFLASCAFSDAFSVQLITDSAAFSDERLSNGTVSVCPSVCLSVPSVDSTSDVQVFCRRQITIAGAGAGAASGQR